MVSFSFEQYEQWIQRLKRIDIKHQTMAVLSNGGSKQRPGWTCSELHDQARPAYNDRHVTTDIGVVRGDLVSQPLHTVELDAFKVDHQSIRA